MAAYVNICPINGKRGKSQTPLNAARHNLREIAAELRGRPGDRIDPSRSHLNQILRGPSQASEVIELQNGIVAAASDKGRRKDNILMFEVVVSVKEHIASIDDFFEEVITWMVALYACPLVSAVVHHDEAEPHIHLLFVPVRDGKLGGHKIIGGPRDLNRMQTAFQAQISDKFGLVRKKPYPSKIRRKIGKYIVALLIRHPQRLAEANVAFVLENACGRLADDLCNALGLDIDHVTNAIALEVEQVTATKQRTARKTASRQALPYV